MRWSCWPSRTATFLPQDVVKLLVYSDECDVVLGTRTTRELIWAGANMDWFLRWGNWAVAKLSRCCSTPATSPTSGCTYRVLRRPAAEHVAREMRVGGSHAGVEIMLLTITSGARYVEVPVNYLPRVGESSVTGKRHRGDQGRVADDRPHPALPAGGAATGRARARVRGRAQGRRGGP